jgi:hypothetical protein
MTATDADSGISIVMADGASGSARIGPLSVKPDTRWRGPDGAHHFIYGSFKAVTFAGRLHVCEPGNGIDSLRLANFRSDLQILDNARLGSIHIGDHDFYMVFELIAAGDWIQVEFTDPSQDVWGRELTSIPWDRLPGIIEQIGVVERSLSPLTGCCGVCSEPRPTYDPHRFTHHEFLVSYDYGEDIVRSVIVAKSEDEVAQLCPELTLEHLWPNGLTDAQYNADGNSQLGSRRPADLAARGLDEVSGPGE